ncbi:DNA polymerase domain-containing protein [Actinotalea subterranea]|uniref:DNA polymerase domain-containing protein n=1 Tax=Actinotalea subterranea TaxID=2607497 RepID=UPI00165DECAE|nr:hypothetical protein [Actinotalea subterranea]
MDEALTELRAGGTWRVHGRDLRVSNLDKILFPGRGDEAPVTKRELLDYAAAIAPTLMPYLRGRALNMHRFPDGAARAGFWHKEVPAHAPDWVSRWVEPRDGEAPRTHLLVNEPATLVWAANFGALEWHAWTSLASAPDLPTYVLFDVDPGTATAWPDVLLLAKLHRDALAHLNVTASPKVTGKRGIQIWVPIEPGPTFDETRAWAEAVSRAIGAVVPELVSWRWEVRGRDGLARLDYTQNAVNKTLVAPYSPRATPGAPVSAPITWDELDDPALRPDAITIRGLARRLDEHGDLFASVLQPQPLPPVR